jgi:FMN phosphatase YigB (HAD superfamily)
MDNQHNNFATELENAKSLAADCRPEIIKQWVESQGDRYSDLDDMIYMMAHEEADRLCIYTHDNRMILRTLEDAGLVDNYCDLLCGDEDHDRRMTVIAYTFWSNEIGAALHEMFAEDTEAA